MEFLVEILFDLLFEGGLLVSTNQKVSKWIRYPLIALIITFFLLVVFGLLFLGFWSFKENVYFGLFLIGLALFMLGSGIIKFRNLYILKKKDL